MRKLPSSEPSARQRQPCREEAMQHINKTLPQGKKQWTAGFASLEEASWTCRTCGESPVPRYFTAIERYMKASCACQRAEEERLRAKEEARKRRAVEMEQVHATYGWLGYGLSDTILVEKTFKTFDVLRQRDAYQATLSFVDLMTGTFILHGSYGTGKTHLLAALTNELRIRGTRCRFCTAPRLFAAIGGCINNGQDYTSLLSKAVQADLLVIDDIDKAKHSEFREEVYFSIIDERAN